jgi:membrane protease YdiL (CAAX protease family)
VEESSAPSQATATSPSRCRSAIFSRRRSGGSFTTALDQAFRRRVTLGEIAIALGIPTALSLTASITWLFRTHGIVRISNAQITSTIAVELILASIIVPYLRKRGWRPGDIAGSPAPIDVLRGFGVFLSTYLTLFVVFVVLHFAAPAFIATMGVRRITGTLSPGIAIIGAIINPIFEEFLWLGYTIPAIGARYGLRAAVVASVVLRVAVHSYQGNLALMTILPTGLVFTWYFVRTGRLWPVIVAHAVVDAVAFAALRPR